MTHERARWAVPQSEHVADLSVALETDLGLQDVEAFQEVQGEGLPQEESVREGLEGLSVWHQSER